MTVERYNTPNHPRWNPRTNEPPTEAAASRWRYERPSPPRDGRPTEQTPRPELTGGAPDSEPPLLLSREATGDDAAVELRTTPDRVWITTELPDRSLDDVRVSVDGASIRIRAGPSEGSPPSGGIDRTLTLSEAVHPADVALAYHDPVLTVAISR